MAALKIGQLRNSDLVQTNDIMQVLDIESDKINVQNPFEEKNVHPFEDLVLKIANNGKFLKGQTYYLNFKIQKIPEYFYSGKLNFQAYKDADQLDFTLVLQDNKNDNSVITESLDSFSVKTRTTRLDDLEPEYTFFETVFTPTQDFTNLVFKVARRTYDAFTPNMDDETLPGGRKWLTGDVSPRQPDGEIWEERTTAAGDIIKVRAVEPKIVYTGTECDFCLLHNIIPNGITWKKFGFQSRPGTLIVVNGEPIRVGRSGIYEINNGTKIKSFMIAAPGRNIDAFLLDYLYEENA